MTSADTAGTNPRKQLVSEIERLWSQNPELRFGQMLMQALMRKLDVQADANIALISDDELRAALAERWVEESKRGHQVLPGPYWDTETQGSGNFMHGLPRDPARVTPFLEVLSKAWDRHSDMGLCALIAEAAGASWIAGIEDGQLRKALASMAGPPTTLA